MKHLYFVRHGLSVMNQKGLFSGRTETPLAPAGMKQAIKAGQAAKNLKIDFIISSPMERARETAEIIAQAIGYPIANIACSDLFIERAFGVLEGEAYLPSLDVVNHEGVESDEAILDRARQGISYLQSLRHNNILIVSHGAIGRALRHILAPETHFRDTARFNNAEIVKLF